MPSVFLFGSARDAAPPLLDLHRGGELQAGGRPGEKSDTAWGVRGARTGAGLQAEKLQDFGCGPTDVWRLPA